MNRILFSLALVGVVSLLFPVSAVRAEEKVLKGLTQSEVDESTKVHIEKGWHPIHIKGYAKGKESLFDVTWKSGKAAWHLQINMSAKAFEEHKKKFAKEGLKVTRWSKWKVAGEERFAAIWKK